MIGKNWEKQSNIALKVLYVKNGYTPRLHFQSWETNKNLNHEKKKNNLMILNEEGWHYSAVKKLSALLRWITSKHVGIFFCLNGLDLFTTKSNSASHKKVCKNKTSCGFVMLSEEIKLLEFN